MPAKKIQSIHKDLESWMGGKTAKQRRNPKRQGGTTTICHFRNYVVANGIDHPIADPDIENRLHVMNKRLNKTAGAAYQRQVRKRKSA